MLFTHAITRTPAETFASGLTTANLGSPNYPLILQQHQAYISILISLGLKVEILPPLPEFPDAYFVEDVAVVTPHIAVITRPGAKERLGEEVYIETTIAKNRLIARIEAPGTVDGGDVMQVENHFYVGVSDRTNEDGAGQLCRILQQYGHTCSIVPVQGGLHLKSEVSYIGNNTLLMNENITDAPLFDQYDRIVIENEEAYAANSLWINNTILTPSGFPRTKDKLLKANFNIIEVGTSELQKMDGGLSCLSLRY